MMASTLKQIACAVLEQDAQNKLLIPFVTRCKRNPKYGSILVYHHDQHIATINEGYLIWRGGVEMVNDRKAALRRAK